MRILILIMALIVPAYAQDLPIPSALREAKTMYVVNSGVHARTLKQTVEALQKWGRFTIVADATSADVTLTLSAQPTKQTQIVNLFVPGGLQTVSVNLSFFSITDTTSGTALYGAAFANNPNGELKKLRKRLEMPEPPHYGAIPTTVNGRSSR